MDRAGSSGAPDGGRAPDGATAPAGAGVEEEEEEEEEERSPRADSLTPAPASRLVDEAVEPDVRAPDPVPVQSRIAPNRVARPGAAPGAEQPPSAAELRRFRDRLERTAREL